MPTHAFRRLLHLERSQGVSVAAKGEALEVKVLRGEIEVTVVVPESVLEWFVDVDLRGTGSRISDWCDYRGYDNTSTAELDQEMAEEVARFVNSLIERDLRYVEDTKHPKLEWSVDGQWHQAVPLSSECA